MNSVPGTTPRQQTIDDGDGLLLFDADCPFCRRSVRWLLKRERDDSHLRITGLESELSRRLGAHFQVDVERCDSIWYIAEGEIHRDSEALWRLADRLERPWQTLRAMREIPRPLRDGVYRFIGDHRHRLAMGGSARLEGHERWANHLSPELCRRCGLASDLADENPEHPSSTP